MGHPRSSEASELVHFVAYIVKGNIFKDFISTNQAAFVVLIILINNVQFIANS